jgi:hypothetical protein
MVSEGGRALTSTPRPNPWPFLSQITAGLLVAACASVTPVAAAPESAVVPQVASVYWGAYLNGAPFDSSQIDNFEAQTGKRMSIVHWGQPWISGGTYQTFQTKQYDAVRSRGAIPMVDWGSWDVSSGATQPAFRLANLTNGKYDTYIKQWAQSARAWGQPFFLRFDWEMNGWWQFPWAESINNNEWGDYVKAWRHVHDVFVGQGATNATWVWCPNISSARTRSLAGLYPGDSYVDWTCMDGYNFGSDNGNLWQSFGQVFGGSAYNANHNTYAELLAVAPNKPIMIGETASSERGGSKAAWISDMLSQLPTSFPQIKALVWFNWNGGDPNVSWPVTSSPAAHQAFSSGIAAPAYAASDFGSGPKVVPPGINSALPAPSVAAPPAGQQDQTHSVSLDDQSLAAVDPSAAGATGDAAQDVPGPTSTDAQSAN